MITGTDNSNVLFCFLPVPSAFLHSAATPWQLEVERLTLLDVQLQPQPGATAAPVLWPVNLFGSIGSMLSLQDVQLVLHSSAVFSRYLEFFQAQPVLKSNVNSTLHTVSALKLAGGYDRFAATAA